MNEVILFLLESSVALGVFYLIYYVLLRREASFHFNRFYLLGAMVISLLLPLLSVDVSTIRFPAMDQPIRQLSDVRSGYKEAVDQWSYGLIDQGLADAFLTVTDKEKPTNWVFSLLLIGYSIGLIAMLFRFSWTLTWITRLRQKYPNEKRAGVTIVKVPYQLAPFSFIDSVFVPEELLESEEFAHILEHEKTHIRQRHSCDLLIIQLLTAFLWFNPVVWWLNKSLKTTHEYIADRNMIKKGYSLVEYQTLLLRQLISNNSFGLVHNFNLSFIKQRITMMNIQKIGHLGRFKVVAVSIMTLLFSLIIVQCNSKLEEQEPPLINKETAINLPEIETEYFFDIKENLRFDIIIKDDQVYFKDELITLEELGSFDGNFPEKAQIVLQVDKGQKMKLVHEVQEVLREKDLRLIVYQGRDSRGELLSVPILLPPSKKSKSPISLPELTPEFIAENGIHMMEFDMNVKDVRFDQLSYNALRDPMIAKGSIVIRGRFTDETSFGDYLIGVNGMKNGYYQFYDERAQELYGRSFYDINREREMGNEEAKELYNEVRKGYPMSIVFEKI